MLTLAEVYMTMGSLGKYNGLTDRLSAWRRLSRPSRFTWLGPGSARPCALDHPAILTGTCLPPVCGSPDRPSGGHQVAGDFLSCWQR